MAKRAAALSAALLFVGLGLAWLPLAMHYLTDNVYFMPLNPFAEVGGGAMASLIDNQRPMVVIGTAVFGLIMWSIAAVGLLLSYSTFWQLFSGTVSQNLKWPFRSSF